MATVSNDNNDIQLLADGCTALLQSVFGDNNWYRWNEIKQQTQHDSLQTFITWMLDVAEQEINRPETGTAIVDNDDRREPVNFYTKSTDDVPQELLDDIHSKDYILDGSQNIKEPAVVDLTSNDFDIKEESGSGRTEDTYYSQHQSHDPSTSSQENPVELICNQNMFSCGACNVSLSDAEVVQEHIDLRHSEQTISICCFCCSQKFYSMDDYIAYHTVSTNSLQSKHVCQYCAKRFSAKQYMEDHIANKHLKLGPRHQCPHCGKKFSHCNNMKTHVKVCSHKQ